MSTEHYRIEASPRKGFVVRKPGYDEGMIVAFAALMVERKCLHSGDTVLAPDANTPYYITVFTWAYNNKLLIPSVRPTLTEKGEEVVNTFSAYSGFETLEAAYTYVTQELHGEVIT